MRGDAPAPTDLSVAELAGRFEERYERGVVVARTALVQDLLALAVAIMERLPDDLSRCADRENATDLMILSRIVKSLRADKLSFQRQAVRFADEKMDDDQRRNRESVAREINDTHPMGN